MKSSIVLTGSALLMSATGVQAAVCKEVNYNFNYQSIDDSARAISDAGWLKVNLFGAPVGGRAGWFRFADGTVMWAVHNGTVSSLQWTLFTDRTMDADDCTVTLPQPGENDQGVEDEEDEESEDEEEHEDAAEHEEEIEEFEHEWDGECTACEIEDWNEETGEWEEGEWIEEEQEL